MRPDLASLPLVALLTAVLMLTCGLTDAATADEVPFACTILPDEELASVVMTNSLTSDASCIVTCRFATTRSDNSPQITCAKAVPSGKEVEMCRLTSGGDKFVKLIEGRADCSKLSTPNHE